MSKQQTTTLAELRRNAISAAVVLLVVMVGALLVHWWVGAVMKPLALSDRQLQLVTSAAKAVPVRQRSDFLQAIANHLASEPTDAAVLAVVNSQLDLLPRFLCDSATTKKDQVNEQTTPTV